MFATVSEQLAAWVEGKTRGMGVDAHVWLSRSGVDNCVPDFSCCRPSLEASEEVRRAFVTASPANRRDVLAGFLVALLARRLCGGSFTQHPRMTIVLKDEE